MAAVFTNRLPPLPVDADTMRAIKREARKSRQSQASVIRQSINLGLPQIVRTHSLEKKHRPKCLDWLNDYPLSPVAARHTKSALRERIARKNGLHC